MALSIKISTHLCGSSRSTLSPRTFHLATNTIFQPGTEMMQRSVTYRSSTFQRTSTNNLGVLTETASRAQHLSTNGTSEGSGSRSCRYLMPAESPRDNSVVVQCKHLWNEVRGDELPTQARSHHKVSVHNVPLEIPFYLVSETRLVTGQLINQIRARTS